MHGVVVLLQLCAWVTRLLFDEVTQAMDRKLEEDVKSNFELLLKLKRFKLQRLSLALQSMRLFDVPSSEQRQLRWHRLHLELSLQNELKV
jgi:hypothetical protein